MKQVKFKLTSQSIDPSKRSASDGEFLCAE